MVQNSIYSNENIITNLRVIKIWKKGTQNVSLTDLNFPKTDKSKVGNC
jgi:hypothetical protein